MNRQIVIALALLLSMGSVDVSAQGLLKHLTNTVKKEVKDRVTKEVKKTVNKKIDQVTGNQSTTQQSAAKPTAKSAPQDKMYQTTENLKTANDIGEMVPYGPLEGTVNGYKWVDMGLPSGTRWATCNVDAKAPEQPGKLYAWGEIATKSSYTKSNNKFYSKDVDDFSGDKANDVARAKWGATWRVPTEQDFKELVHYCNWQYVQMGGRWGVKFTNNKNGNSIFLPVTGYRDGASLRDASGNGLYWTSTPYKDNYNNGAHMYQFGAALGEMGVGERYTGYAIRPVMDYEANTEIIPTSGEMNGHKWVDLGLPSGVKWAIHNVGADKVDADGDYYNWGELTSSMDKTSKKNNLYGKESGDIGGNPSYDIARKQWGGTWRIPTEEELLELREHCIFEMTSIGRRQGLKVTSKINGNYIFLPLAGRYTNMSYSYGVGDDINKVVGYWSSTPCRREHSYEAYALFIRGPQYSISSNYRNKGLSIRPVTN